VEGEAGLLHYHAVFVGTLDFANEYAAATASQLLILPFVLGARCGWQLAIFFLSARPFSVPPHT